MAGNSQRRGAIRKGSSKKGATVGSGGQRRRGLEGRGATPPAEARTKHPALELGQLRCQRCHLRIGLLPQGLEGRAGLHEQVLERLQDAVHEAGLYFEPYGFSVSDLSQPIHYWWGTKDTAVVELHAREIEQKAAHSVLHYREGEGHLSLYVNCFGEALQTIAQHA